MPTLCSNQPEVTLKQLNSDQEYAFDCLQALVSKLLARRELTAEEAREYTSDPREGDFRKVLKRSWSSPKKRTQEEKGKSTKGRPPKNQKSTPGGSGQAGQLAGTASVSELNSSKKSGTDC